LIDSLTQNGLCRPPWGSGVIGHPTPGLPAWAKLFRACGAGFSFCKQLPKT